MEAQLQGKHYIASKIMPRSCLKESIRVWQCEETMWGPVKF